MGHLWHLCYKAVMLPEGILSLWGDKSEVSACTFQKDLLNSHRMDIRPNTVVVNELQSRLKTPHDVDICLGLSSLAP